MSFGLVLKSSTKVFFLIVIKYWRRARHKEPLDSQPFWCYNKENFKESYDRIHQKFDCRVSTKNDKRDCPFLGSRCCRRTYSFGQKPDLYQTRTRMKTSYYIPGLNFTKDAPMDFLLMVAHNTVQYKLDGYVFLLSSRSCLFMTTIVESSLYDPPVENFTTDSNIDPAISFVVL